MNEVQAEASGTYVVERAAFQFRRLDGYSFVRQQNLNSTLRRFLPAWLDAAAAHLDREARASAVRVAQNVGEGLIHGADDGARLGVLKVQHFGGALHGGANEAQSFRIALQLQLQKHFGLGLGLFATQLSVLIYASTAHSYTRPSMMIWELRCVPVARRGDNAMFPVR